MLIKCGLKSKLVSYYEAMMSMSIAAMFKFTPAFTWPSAWPVVTRLRNDLYCVEWGVKLYSLTRLLYQDNMYMKSNLTKDVLSHDYKLTVLY